MCLTFSRLCWEIKKIILEKLVVFFVRPGTFSADPRTWPRAFSHRNTVPSRIQSWFSLLARRLIAVKITRSRTPSLKHAVYFSSLKPNNAANSLAGGTRWYRIIHTDTRWEQNQHWTKTGRTSWDGIAPVAIRVYKATLAQRLIRHDDTYTGRGWFCDGPLTTDADGPIPHAENDVLILITVRGHERVYFFARSRKHG